MDSIKIERYEILLSRLFSRAVVGTTDYSARGQNDAKKIEIDHFIGKLGEFATYKVLIKLGYKVLKPDLEIYTKNKKSHADDLVGDVNLKVKSVSSDSPFGLSWVFQFSPNPDPIFTGRTQGHISFCVVNLRDKSVDFISILPVKDIVSLMKLPIKDSLKDYKRVIYKKDLDEHIQISGRQIQINPELISVFQ